MSGGGIGSGSMEKSCEDLLEETLTKFTSNPAQINDIIAYRMFNCTVGW